MLFTRSTFFIACTLAAGMGLSACSKSNNEEKQAPLTASTPATGEASTLTERNAQQRLISTLQDGLKKANINAKITDAQPTEVPNLYWISFEGMPSVYATADGKYILQGEIVRLGGKELHNVSQNLQAANAKKLFDQLKTEDLIVYPAKGKTKHVYMSLLMPAARIAINCMSIWMRSTAKASKSAISHGRAANSSFRQWKASGAAKTANWRSIKPFLARSCRQRPAKIQCATCIKWA